MKKISKSCVFSYFFIIFFQFLLDKIKIKLKKIKYNKINNIIKSIFLLKK